MSIVSRFIVQVVVLDELCVVDVYTPVGSIADPGRTLQNEVVVALGRSKNIRPVHDDTEHDECRYHSNVVGEIVGGYKLMPEFSEALRGPYLGGPWC